MEPKNTKWRFSVTKGNICLICICILLNLFGRWFAGFLELPLWLDCIGTFLSAVLLGPLGGAFTGFLTNFFINIWMSDQLWFALVNLSGGIAVGRLFPRDRKITAFSVIATAIYAAFIMVVISTPLNMIFHHGYIGNLWGDALIDMLHPYINAALPRCFLGELFINVPDKVLNILIIMSILYFVKKWETKNLHKISLFLLLCFTVFFIQKPISVFASTDYNTDYVSTIYGEESGLASIEMNTITQTKTGYIWAGSYSGLYRFNGSKFEKMNLDDRISNVTCLFEDSLGLLWIGTNDSGVFCYDPDTKKVSLFSVKNGLSSNSIRSICEGEDHTLYISTASQLCRINSDHTVFAYEDLEEIICVYNLSFIQNKWITGVTKTGLLFVLKDDKLLAAKEYKNAEDADNPLSYTAAACDAYGNFFVGTTGDAFEKLYFNGKTFRPKGLLHSTDIFMTNYILYSENANGFFIAGNTGFGFATIDGDLQTLTKEHFSSAISQVIEDYQDNIWFASTKQGILKLSENPFVNILKNKDLTEKIPSGAVNATLFDKKILYIGTDNGMYSLNTVNQTLVKTKFSPLMEKLHGERIRHIMQDRKGGLWVSTYGEIGLAHMSGNGKLTLYHGKDHGLLGNRFRFTLEMKNGDIAAFSTEGINFLKNGNVVNTMGTKEGLIVPQILSAVETEDGTLLAGSDGGGVYVIKNGAIIDTIDTEDGLNALIILKIVPCKTGCLYVTSNGIYYASQTEQIRKLEHFPYSNNYDIYITEDGIAWITGSAGIYVTNLENMIKDKKYQYVLLNKKWGLDTTFTANAWNSSYGDDFFICCTDGIRQINTKTYHDFNRNYNIIIHSFLQNDTKNVPLKNDTYMIPAGTGTLQIQPVILNYTMSDPLISVSIDGIKKTTLKAHQSELPKMYVNNFPYGNYILHVRVISEIDGSILKEASFQIYKPSRLYERGYFKVYLLFVCAMLIGFLAWLIAEMSNMAVINRQYDQIREAKEEAEYANQAKSKFLANMSHEIRTPINAVLGMDEMILRESTEPDIRGYAADIFTAGTTLLSLINDILDSSKIESGKMEIVPVEYELSTLLRDLVNMIQGRVQAKDLIFEVEAQSNLPAKLFGDDVRIRQVITNILTNAVKYTPSGTVWFRITGTSEGEEATLRFEVEDTGIGIKEEDMPKLFEEFQRIEESRNRNIEGTGLGMNITIQLLALMGSKLQVKSVYGKGSVFYFDLKQKIIDHAPLGDVKEILTHSADSYTYEGGFQAPDAKVLVVDDNATNRKVFKSLLKITKIQVTEAGSGKEALELVNKEDYDMIFTDHMMPDMDGVETMQRMRTLEKLKNTPIYVLTANAVTGAKEQYLELGFDGFLSKPIISEKLELALKEGLPENLLQPLEEQISTQPEKKPTFSTDDYPAVDGLDWSYAVMHLPDEELLISTVKDFYDVLFLQADKLQEMYESLKNVSSPEQMAAYRIQVHAMKSVAATIGIVPLAGMAKILEYAAREENQDIILSLHDIFINEWKSYHQKLTGVFGIGSDTGTKEPADREMLFAMFSMLRPALEDFDLDTADQVLEKLESYRYPEEVENSLPELIAAVKEMDEEEAKRIMKEMENSLQ